jgi:hypothetical protein
VHWLSWSPCILQVTNIFARAYFDVVFAIMIKYLMFFDDNFGKMLFFCQAKISRSRYSWMHFRPMTNRACSLKCLHLPLSFPNSFFCCRNALGHFECACCVRTKQRVISAQNEALDVRNVCASIRVYIKSIVSIHDKYMASHAPL